jgi:ribosomal protein S6
MILKDDKEATVSKITDLIVSKKGVVESNDKWGKKTFSYPIKKTSSGYYFLLSLKAPQGEIQDFKKKLDYNEDVLRYLLITI